MGMEMLARRGLATLSRAPTGIVMLTMGGPTTLDAVEGFLTNVFTDPEILPLGRFQHVVGPWLARRRAPRIQAQYAQIGGGSPILRWTELQGERMCELLDAMRPQSAPHKHYACFRYANPSTEMALRQMREDGVRRAIAFSQYPQWSCTTTGSSLNHLWRELERLEMTEDFEWSIIDRWHTHPLYIEAVAQRVKQGLEEFPKEEQSKVVIVFSAHSVPMQVVNKGDPYTKDIAATAELIMQDLGRNNLHMLSWQSKVGFVPWMGPSTKNVLKGLGAQGYRHVLVVPIAFTTDHIETLFEIDHELAEVAKESGIMHFKRSPSLNDSSILSRAMAQLVKDHLDSDVLHSTQYPLRCHECKSSRCRTITNPISAGSMGA